MGHFYFVFINDLPLKISDSKVTISLLMTHLSTLAKKNNNIQSVETALQGSLSEIYLISVTPM